MSKKIILDENLPRRLKKLLPGHAVFTVQEMGWSGKQNGELLAAMREGVDVFITMDKNMHRQHDFSKLPFAVLLLRAPNNRIEGVQPLVPTILSRLDALKPGDYAEIQ
jgi:predicted nuclease of predicted toxin-antitoxin system